MPGVAFTGPPSAAARQPAPSRRRLARIGLFVLLATLIGLLSASIIVTTDWAEGRAANIEFPLLMELTGAYTFLLLIPFILGAVRRFPITRATWWYRVPLHLVLSMVIGATHTLLMWGTRSVAYWALDWGTYDYGVMRFRFLMEYQKQFLSYCLVYIAGAGLAFVRRARERELQATALQSQLTEARLDALKAQLNPHFLFNTLHMISSYVYTAPQRADAMIANLSDLLRESLRYSDMQEVTVEQELRSLRRYLDIMSARFDDRLAIDVDAPADTHAALVPHLILQPLVENAVAHGTARATDAGRIRISVSQRGDRLRLVIDDNGPGFDGDGQSVRGRGVGLSNAAERLRAHYGERQRLDIGTRPEGGARVSIELPWHTTAEARP
jgi:two-component system, LytTR family, sensor kinase